MMTSGDPSGQGDRKKGHQNPPRVSRNQQATAKAAERDLTWTLQKWCIRTTSNITSRNIHPSPGDPQATMRLQTRATRWAAMSIPLTSGTKTSRRCQRSLDKGRQRGDQTNGSMTTLRRWRAELRCQRPLHKGGAKRKSLDQKYEGH